MKFVITHGPIGDEQLCMAHRIPTQEALAELRDSPGNGNAALLNGAIFGKKTYGTFSEAYTAVNREHPHLAITSFLMDGEFFVRWDPIRRDVLRICIVPLPLLDSIYVCESEGPVQLTDVLLGRLVAHVRRNQNTAIPL